MHQRRVGIVFRVLEPRNEVVAALAHANDLGAVQGKVELVFVGLSKATEDEGVIVTGNDEDDVLVFSAGVVVGDSEGFGDFGEGFAIVDNSDKSATKRVDRVVAGEFKASEASRVDDGIGTVLGEELLLLVEEITSDSTRLHDCTLADQNESEPVHVSVRINDWGQVLIGVNDTSLLVDLVFAYNVGIASDTFDLE